MYLQPEIVALSAIVEVVFSTPRCQGGLRDRLSSRGFIRIPPGSRCDGRCRFGGTRGDGEAADRDRGWRAKEIRSGGYLLIRRLTSSRPAAMPAMIPASTTPTIFIRPRQGFLGTSAPSSAFAVPKKMACRHPSPRSAFAKAVPRPFERGRGAAYLPRATLQAGTPRAQGRGMIVGVGIDMVRIERVWGVLQRRGERAYARFFTAAERERCGGSRHPPESFAARFAAKEAFYKAMGTGVGIAGAWTEVEVVSAESGAPSIR